MNLFTIRPKTQLRSELIKWRELAVVRAIVPRLVADFRTLYTSQFGNPPANKKSGGLGDAPLDTGNQ
jgi:hypothetical protein